MQRALGELLDACERLLGEEKTKSKEWSVLFLATKGLKECAQAVKSGSASSPLGEGMALAGAVSPQGPATDFLPPAEEAEMGLSASQFAMKGGKTPTLGENLTQAPTENLSEPLPTEKVKPTMPVEGEGQLKVAEPTSHRAIQGYLSDENELSRLAHACYLALTGGSSSLGGGMTRVPTRVLLIALELSTILLDSGIIPLQLRATLLSGKPSGEAVSGTQLFLSKFLGLPTKSTSSRDQSSAGSAASSPDAEEGTEDVRTVLVDAVVATAESVRAREGNDKLCFVFIAALRAAAAPRVCRSRSADVESSQIRGHHVCLSGDRLRMVLQLLFSTLSWPARLSLLGHAARNAIHGITKAALKCSEQGRHDLLRGKCGGRGDEKRRASCEVVNGMARIDAEPHPRRESLTRITGSSDEAAVAISCETLSGYSEYPTTFSADAVEDLLTVLQFCADLVARRASLSAASCSGGDFATGGPVRAKGKSLLPGSSSATQKDAQIGVALSVILHMIVNGGPVLRRTNSILNCIRHSVLPAAVRASALLDVDVFRLSLNVLLTCSATFGPQLVHETGTIFRHVYFRVLESSHTLLDQKLLVIEAFQRYIVEPQDLIGLFLNYDCNSLSCSIYEEMIQYLGALAKPDSAAVASHITDGPLDSSHTMRRVSCSHSPIASGRGSDTGIRIPYDVPEVLRRKALLALLLVADSTIQWIERFETNPEEGDPYSIAIHRVPGPPADRTVEEDEDVASTSRHAGSGSSDVTIAEAFRHAKRYRGFLRQFLFLFHEPGRTTDAIKFLCNCSPLLHPEDLPTDSTALGASEASLKPPSLAESSEVDEDKAKAIARFMRENEEYLDKIVLGKYFAEAIRENVTRIIFEEWISLHDFSHMTLDEALRLFLGGFKLLGEAQVVDKTMELFAGKYLDQNPGAFSSTDTAFILSFSICMLNTDAHSPHVRSKMTLEAFISNNRGISEGGDVDPSILIGIYERITQKEIVLRPSTKLPSWLCSGTVDTAAAEKELASGPLTSSGAMGSTTVLTKPAPSTLGCTDDVHSLMNTSRDAELRTAPHHRGARYSDGDHETSRITEGEVPPSSTAAFTPVFVTATSIENALPMWEATVDILSAAVIDSLWRLYADVEKRAAPLTDVAGERCSPTDGAGATCAADGADSEYHKALLRGIVNTCRVCCSFGNVHHTEVLMESMFFMTSLSQTVVITSKPTLQVVLTQRMPRMRAELVVVFLNLFVSLGKSFTSRCWQMGYSVMSLLDALANGIDGLWKRQAKRINHVEVAPTIDAKTPLPTAGTPPDQWFGSLEDAPATVGRQSLTERTHLLEIIRAAPFSAVDGWLDRLFDATRCSPSMRIHMVGGLAWICEKELRYSRTFSTTKLFDFITACASFSTRLQWRELWSSASPVFVMAGNMTMPIAGPALDGLRIIALNLLVREELRHYSFQKEMLKPFQDILMSNKETEVRLKVLDILSEVLDAHAEHLASGWHVMFACLSHAAAIPETTETAWSVCEGILFRHISHVRECFSDLVFCLTTFSCTGWSETVSLRGVSYLVACGHWLQYGLIPPPAEVREAHEILHWARRFQTAEQEGRAFRTLGSALSRVTLSPEPLTKAHPLERPNDSTRVDRYYLWMSLFEGLAPIANVHASIRVRSHALCSLWALVQQYAPVFSVDAQDALFTGVLRRTLKMLVQQVPRLPTTTQVDRMGYRTLVYLGLKGMTLSCNGAEHLLTLACETLIWLCTSAEFTIEMLQNDVVDIVLRTLGDFLMAAGFTCAPPPPSTTACWEGVAEMSQRDRFPSSLASLSGESSVLFRGLMHKVLQTGAVDVVRFKRTAGWREVHGSAAASASGVTVPPSVQTSSMQSLVRQTVLRCLSQGLLVQLQESLRKYAEDRGICLLISRILRHVMLSLSFYCASTEDLSGLAAFLGIGRSEDVTQTRQPVEILLLHPYQCILLEFIFTYHSFASPEAHSLVQEFLSAYVRRMQHARDYCIEHQQKQQQLAQLHAPSGEEGPALPTGSAKRTESLETKSLPKGRSTPHSGTDFVSIFKGAQISLGDREQQFASSLPATSRHRALLEYSYLLHVLGLRCVLALRDSSIIAQSLSKGLLFTLLTCLPSAFEEATGQVFFSSIWEEMDLRCCEPDACTLVLCVDILRGHSQGDTQGTGDSA